MWALLVKSMGGEACVGFPRGASTTHTHSYSLSLSHAETHTQHK